MMSSYCTRIVLFTLISLGFVPLGFSQEKEASKKRTVENAGTNKGGQPAIEQRVIPAQQVPEKADSKQDRMASIEERLERLESRLTRIERVLFATVKYSEAAAKKELKQAKATVEYSERLHAKGLISALQLTLDRTNLRRAEILAQMCSENVDERKIAATLDLFDARFELQRMKLELDRTEALFERSLIARRHLESDLQAVKNAEKKVAVAKEKLKALAALNEQE